MPTIKRAQRITSNDLADFLRAFAEETAVLPNGDVQFLTIGHDDFFEILPDAFEFPPTFTRRQVRKVLRRGLLDCRKANTMSEAALVKRAELLAKAELAQKPVRFTLWTKLRATQMSFSPGFTISWNGVRIRSAKRIPAWLRVGKYHLSGFGEVDPEPPAFFGFVVITCDARDEETAVDRMLDAWQLVMGLANLYARLGHYSYHSGRHWTDGQLWLGPYQFVFRRKKFLGSERIWYNPDYLGEAWRRNPIEMKALLKQLPSVRRAMKSLDVHPMREVLVQAILLFQDGMAARDPSHRLLRYWSALEQLYGDDGRNKNYQRIIQRAVFADTHRSLERWKLFHASQLRNQYVHAGGLDSDLDAATEHLRGLLGRHINHLLLVRGDLRSHGELLEMLDLPADVAALEMRKITIDRRIDYMKGAEAVAVETAANLKAAVAALEKPT